MVCFAAKLISAKAKSVDPTAAAPMVPGVEAPVSVRFNTTDDTPAVGTPPRPVTWMAFDCCGVTAPLARVSRIRDAATALKLPGVTALPGRKYPLTSTITLTAPADRFATVIAPAVPGGLITVSDTVCPGAKLTVDVDGALLPVW